MSLAQERKKLIKTVLEETLISHIVGQDFKVAIFKCVQRTICKELKKIMNMMPHQIENKKKTKIIF